MIHLSILSLYCYYFVIDPDGLSILFTLLRTVGLQFFMPKFYTTCAGNRKCNSEKRESHIEQSVCLLQRITARIIRTRVSLPTLFVLNFDRG